ncbi:MAG: hypothetical protein M3Q46_08130 [Verrucomicrobiota bacterium]|nr:hypothetical protein [Verrucomicrobiota bacterium]
MNYRITSRIVLAIALLYASASPAQGKIGANAPIDETLFTTYFFNDQTSATWVTCGSTQNTSGCYAAGTLGPYGKIAAMMEGYPRTNVSTNTVSREIYVVDVAGGPNQDQVTLNVYKKTDMITPDFDTVTVVLTQSVPLALTGGTSAKALMAANKGFLFVGTNRSAMVDEIDKRSLAVTPLGPYSTNLTSITADQYGYVTVAFGFEFTVFGPDGSGQLGGGGTEFMLNPIQGVPATFPPPLQAPAR